MATLALWQECVQHSLLVLFLTSLMFVWLGDLCSEQCDVSTSHSPGPALIGRISVLPIGRISQLVCVCICVHVFMHAQTRVDVFLYCSPLYILRQGLSLNPAFTYLLSGQQVLEILLVSFSHHNHRGHQHLPGFSHKVLGIPAQIFMLGPSPHPSDQGF